MRLPAIFLRLLCLCAAGSCLVTTYARAQDRIDPVGMGKARASVATARGLSAIASNPGGLDLFAVSASTLQTRLSFSVYSGGGAIGSTYLSAADYQQLFGNASEITNQQRERIGSLLQDEKLVANGAINLFTLCWHVPGGGTMGLHYGHRAFARMNFPADFGILVSTSNIAARSYEFTNRGIGADWTTELGLSYGRAFGTAQNIGWFPTFGAGVTLKLLGGVAHFDVSESSIITIDQINLNGNLGFIVGGGYEFRSSVPDEFRAQDAIGQFATALFPATAGNGIGADIGLSGVLYRTVDGRDAVYFGITVQDLGSINWNTNTKVRAIKGIHDTLSSSSLQNDQFNKYQGSLVTIPEFTTLLPTVVRAGFAVNLPVALGLKFSPLIVEVEGEFPMNTVPGNAPNSRVSVGADYQASSAVALRGGVTVGGTGTKLGLGLGIGLRPADWLALDLGVGDIIAIAAGNRVEAAFRLSAGF